MRIQRKWISLLLGLIVLCCLVSYVTVHSPYDYAPAWAPNGSLLAFTCYEPSLGESLLHIIGASPPHMSGDIPYDHRDAEICLVKSNGKRVRLTHNRVPDSGPIWSPDSSKIAFVSRQDLGSDIYIMNSDGTEQTRLTHTGSADDLAWSPEGNQICYRSGNYLWLVNVNTGLEQRLTNNVEMEGYPVWAPNGKAIAFIALEKGQFDWWTDQAEIRLLVLNTGEQRVLGTTSPGWKMAWSPDGKHLAFMGSQREHTSGLYLVNIETLEITQLTEGDKYVEEGIAWSTDEQEVFYIASGGIYVAKVDGSGQSLVAKIDNIVTFVGVRNLVLSSNNNLVALMRTEGLDISKIWVMDLEEGAIIRANSGW